MPMTGEIRDLSRLKAAQRIEWALAEFPGQTVLSTSFGIQSAVMLHLASKISAKIPVIFVDTGYLFPETYRYAEQLRVILDLNLKVVTPLRSAAWQEAVDGKRWEEGEQGLAAYNLENKVEPMNRAITELGAKAWLSGLRRGQGSSRENRKFAEKQNQTWKVYPILDWSEKQVYDYMQKHSLPQHPLWSEGYVSVGDWHSTRPLLDTMRPEETRFHGLKRECGLHELSGQADWQI